MDRKLSKHGQTAIEENGRGILVGSRWSVVSKDRKDTWKQHCMTFQPAAPIYPARNVCPCLSPRLRSPRKRSPMLPKIDKFQSKNWFSLIKLFQIIVIEHHLTGSHWTMMTLICHLFLLEPILLKQALFGSHDRIFARTHTMISHNFLRARFYAFFRA